MSDTIRVDAQDGVLTIQFNRPEKKNALTLAMYEAMTAAVRQAELDKAVRVILFTGTEDCFTAGNDLGDFLHTPPTGDDSPVFRFLKSLAAASKPLVAAVNGVAVGIGTTMLLHCDLAYAGQSARFRLPFVDLALVPEAGSSLILPQLMGQRRAAELLMLADTLDATTARDLGIVNAVLPDDRTLAVARQKALQLAAKPPAALRLTKALMKRIPAPAIQEAMGAEGRHFIARLQSPEAREAFQAFLERRPADFSQFD